ncbi:MAG: ester cyclase [Planctomycetes bacterium]|nr:ester cyclase [Planctomycetota bacterium]
MNAEVWNKGNLETLDDFFSPGVVQHFLPDGSEIKGLDQLRDQIRSHRESFPDWAEEIRRIVAGEDLVAIHFVSTGTNAGSFLGHPPTGKQIHINEMSIFRIVDGKIVEQWLIPDVLSLNRQLGFIAPSD